MVFLENKRRGSAISSKLSERIAAKFVDEMSIPLISSRFNLLIRQCKIRSAAARHTYLNSGGKMITTIAAHTTKTGR